MKNLFLKPISFGVAQIISLIWLYSVLGVCSAWWTKNYEDIKILCQTNTGLYLFITLSLFFSTCAYYPFFRLLPRYKSKQHDKVNECQ